MKNERLRETTDSPVTDEQRHQIKNLRTRTSPVLSRLRAERQLRKEIDKQTDSEGFKTAKNSLSLFPEWRRREIERKLDGKLSGRRHAHKLNALLERL